MTINKLLKNRAFTLVETMVAIAILLIAVVGPIGLIGDSLHKIYYAKDEMVAINLAQEGIEVVRQVRDSNMLAISGGVSTTWDAGIGAGTYVVDAFSSTPITSCTDYKVYQDASGYRQTCTASTPTQFTSRKIVITDIGTSPVTEKNITSTVTWNTGGTSGSVTTSENIFNWTKP